MIVLAGAFHVVSALLSHDHDGPHRQRRRPSSTNKHTRRLSKSCVCACSRARSCERPHDADWVKVFGCSFTALWTCNCFEPNTMGNCAPVIIDTNTADKLDGLVFLCVVLQCGVRDDRIKIICIL